MRAVVRVALLLVALPLQAADFIVTNTNAAGAGSLAQAIADANASPGSRILFEIEGTSPFRIELDQAPPPLLEPTQILGGSQPGYVGTPLVTIVSRTASPVFDIRGDLTYVSGLAFELSQGGGVVTRGIRTTVWACTFTRLGAPRGDEPPAIHLRGSEGSASDNRVSFGAPCIAVEGNANTLFGNTLEGCYDTAIALRSGRDHTVGGDFSGWNVIGPAVVYGFPAITVDAASPSNKIAGNRITGTWGGIDVRSDDNYIGTWNETWSGGAFGIRIDGGTGNRITENVLPTANGIVLANGGNHALPAPRLDQVIVSGDRTTVTGSLGKTGHYILELFVGDTCAAGRQFVGSATANQTAFNVTIPAVAPGRSVTAVAIDYALSPTFADSSPHSNCVTASGAASVPAPVLTSVPAEGWPGEEIGLVGTNLHNNARVFFGTAEAAVWHSSTPRFVRVPEGSGTVDVTFRNPDGRQFIARNAFTYRKPAWVYVNRSARSLTIKPGESARLTVIASTEAPPLRYQWFRGALLDRSQPIASETSPTITVKPSESTKYWVEITNARNKFSFSGATVWVDTPMPRRRSTRH